MMSAKILSPAGLSLLFIMLLYEAITKAVIAAPVVLSENGGSLLQATRGIEEKNSNSVKHSIVMPVWARKAGGNWRPALLQQGVNSQSEMGNQQAIPAYQHQPVGETEMNSSQQAYEEDNIKVIEAEAQTGINADEGMVESPSLTITANQIITGMEHQKKNTNGKGNEVQSEEKSKTEENDGKGDEYEYVYDEWESEEPECPEDQYYHIRGKRCVPLSCPGGNAWRDRDTGECILKRYGYRNRWKSNRQWKP